MEDLSQFDIVSVLRIEFSKRCSRNPRYSLRAFAKSLEIDQSLLTKILRGQRNLSAKKWSEVGGKLGLSPIQIEACTKNKNSKQIPFDKSRYQQMADDAFNVISDWYHFALLELLKVEGPQGEPSLLATRLGLHRTEVEGALERLERLGYLERNAEGGWELKSPDNTWSNAEVTTAARRNLQKALLQKSLDAIDHVDFEFRENGSLTIACDESLLPEIRKKFRKFRQELDAFTQAHGNYNQVYQVVTSFFPLTRKVLRSTP